MKVLATYSIKGGVGKTTSAVNLAYEAARSGARVLVWDLDAQGAATFFLRVKPVVKGGAAGLVRRRGVLEPHIRGTDVPSVHVVPADFSLRNLDVLLDDTKHPTERLAALLEPVADLYDVAIIDCPPGITRTSEAVFAGADALLVPTIPTTLSVRTLTQLADFLRDVADPPAVYPFVSMYDQRKSLQRNAVTELAAAWPAMLTTVIPSASVVERMGTERAPVGAFAPRTRAARAFAALWDEIAVRLWS